MFLNQETLNTDYLIIGAGIVGMTIARQLKATGVKHIILLEKENAIGKHASGRNSGVLHTGIYYPHETLKAKLCLKGNRLMQRYCQEKNLPCKTLGKVIVAKNQDDLATLDILYQQAISNGAKIRHLNQEALAKIEPNARTYQSALFVEETAIIDNHAILKSIYNELIQDGIQVLFNQQFKYLEDDNIAITNRQKIKFEHLINAAGAYADKVAHRCGVGKDYSFIPFKGSYRKLIREKSGLINANIYPTPNLKNPFLGVHFTKNIQGEVYIGPTAAPAFGRENYGFIKGMNHEAIKILYDQSKLFFMNPKFRHLALTEPKKSFSRYFYQDAKELVHHLEPEWISPCRKVGIRPQLVNKKTNELEMDFILIKNKQQLHVLNAISPAFTCSLAFADYVVN